MTRMRQTSMNNKQLHTLGRAMLLGVLFIFGALVVQAR